MYKKTSETPPTWVEHLPPSNLSSENPEGLTQRVGTRRQSVRIVVGMPSGSERPELLRLLPGTLTLANLNYL